MRRAALVALALAAGACGAPVVGAAPPERAGLVAPATSRSTPPGGLLNPQVSQQTLRTTVCVSGWSASVRPPASYTESLRGRMLAAYGLAPGTVVEVDHVTPLALGGDPKSHVNLYPEPIAVAREDDKVENRLHSYLCAGRITLADAQAQILALKIAHGYRPDVRY